MLDDKSCELNGVYRNDELIGSSLDEKVKGKIVKFRNAYREMMIRRYYEILPTIITYIDKSETAIDFVKMETMLRFGYIPVVGKDKNGLTCLMGYATNNYTITNTNLFFDVKPLEKKDIQFIISKDRIPKKMNEITDADNCKTGNFITIRNKSLSLLNDTQIIRLFVDELTEVKVSRFSLIMQSKMITLFKGEVGSEDLTTLVDAYYNGAPYEKVSDLIDVDELIVTIDGASVVVGNLAELKRETQNLISELNNQLGIDSLGVDKESGVSNAEATSNKSNTALFSNIYIEPRRTAFQRFAKRFGDTDILPVFNNEVLSIINVLRKEEQTFRDKNYVRSEEL